MRSVAFYRNFHGVVQVYEKLSMHLQDRTNESLNICTSLEWYQFPSHFFLPSFGHRLRFVRFTEQQFPLLPIYYNELFNGTRVIPLHMNDQNQEELDRYVSHVFFSGL
jgi:alpha-1,2-mannosyltransferase